MAELGKMKVHIVSPEKTLYFGSANSVTLPGVSGRFEILPHHAALVTILTNGTIEIRSDEIQKIDIVSGFVEINDDELSICVEN